MNPDPEAKLRVRYPFYRAEEPLGGEATGGDGWFARVDRLLGAIAGEPGARPVSRAAPLPTEPTASRKWSEKWPPRHPR
jgi:hypothetical protein